MHLLRVLYFSLLLLSIMGCQRQKPEDEAPATAGYYPTAGKRYVYELARPSGLPYAREESRVTHTVDSAGLTVSNITTTTTFDDGSDITDSILAHYENSRTHWVLAGTDLYRRWKIYESKEDVLELRLSGYPQSIVFHHGVPAGERLEFPGGPVVLYRKEAGQARIYETWDAVQYSDGRFLAQQNITTPAGTFHCTQWQYEQKLSHRIDYWGVPSPEVNTVIEQTLWLAEGIGVVKQRSRHQTMQGMTETTKTLVRIDG